MATKTDKSEQEALNSLNSTGAHEYTPQEIANIFVGNSKTDKSLQNILNTRKGNATSTEQTVQQALFDNLASTLGLTGSSNSYSVQELLNLAVINGVSLVDVLVPISKYIKSLTNLIAYYPLNEASGSAVNQAPGTVGTLDGTVTGTTRSSTGQVGKAYTFNGTTDVITIAKNTIPSFSGASTIGFIAKSLETTATDKPIIDSQWGDNGGGGWQLIVNNGVLSSAYVGDATNRDVVGGLTQSMTDRFHLIVATKSVANDRQRVFVDGVQIGQTTGLSYGTTQPDTNIDLTFGSNMSKTVFLNCILQHVFFSSAEMTPAQVSTLAKIAGVAS